MSRLPLAGFGVLAVATLAAFFITQHLKVTTPLIAGEPFGPNPQRIHPAGGCASSTTIAFHLLHQADDVDVYVVAHGDKIVRTLASGVPAGRKQPLQFTWNGRLSDGQIAPSGTYNFRVKLIHQRRTIDPLIPGTPVVVESACPAS